MANQYSSIAQATTLTAPINNSATSITVAGTTGFPVATPYTLCLGQGTVNEELVSVTAVAGTTLTVTRGYDGTTAVSHAASETVIHAHSAKDFKDSRDHEALTAGVHGRTGTLVGATDTQTLTNKTIALGSNTVSGTKAQFNAAVTDADLATIDGTETLTNKTLTAPTLTGAVVDALKSSNGNPMVTLTPTASANSGVTISQNTGGSFAQVGASGTATDIDLDLAAKGAGHVRVLGSEVANISTAQTLSNKTLASPVITGVGEVRYIAKAADESVTSSTTLQDDDHITLSLEANATYVVDIRLYFVDSAGVGVTAAFSLPASATQTVGAVNQIANQAIVAASSGSAFATGFIGGPNPLTILGSGTITTAGTAGNLLLRWAQGASSGSPVTLKAGSFITLRRVA